MFKIKKKFEGSKHLQVICLFKKKINLIKKRKVVFVSENHNSDSGNIILST